MYWWFPIWHGTQGEGSGVFSIHEDGLEWSSSIGSVETYFPWRLDLKILEFKVNRPNFVVPFNATRYFGQVGTILPHVFSCPFQWWWPETFHASTVGSYLYVYVYRYLSLYIYICTYLYLHILFILDFHIFNLPWSIPFVFFKPHLNLTIAAFFSTNSITSTVWWFRNHMKHEISSHMTWRKVWSMLSHHHLLAAFVGVTRGDPVWRPGEGSPWSKYMAINVPKR